MVALMLALGAVTLVSGAAILPREPSAPSTLELTDNVFPLIRKTTHGPSGSNRKRANKPAVVGLRNLFAYAELTANINVGGQNFPVQVDTAFADTWVVSKGFQCLDINGTKIPEDGCAFGPVFSGTVGGGAVANENFNLSYTDGEFVSGSFGYADIKIGTITVTHQQVGLVNRAYWNGDDITSGILGLAYSSITRAFVGNDGSIDKSHVTGTAPGDQEPYSPIVQTMIAQGLSPALFSMAIERASNFSLIEPAGHLAFGGLPPVTGTMGNFVSTPIVTYQYPGKAPITASQRSYYSINLDGYVFKNKAGAIETIPLSSPVAIDITSTALGLPTAAFKGYLASFNPPAVHYEGTYYYPCNSTVPYFAIKIAGATFPVSSADIMVPFDFDLGLGIENAETGEKLCVISIYDAGDDVIDVGVHLMKNVVAVFDVGAGLMRFAPHTY